MLEEAERECVLRARDHMQAAQAHAHQAIELLPTRIYAAGPHGRSLRPIVRDWLNYLDGVLELDTCTRKGQGGTDAGSH